MPMPLTTYTYKKLYVRLKYNINNETIWVLDRWYTNIIPT